MDHADQHLVFVYGTLKRGHVNHRWLATSNWLGEGVTAAKFGFYAGPDPFVGEAALIPFAYERSAAGDEAVRVHGELWSVDEATLLELDRLEGHPDWYQRQTVAIAVGEDELEAAMYIIPGQAPSGLHLLASGRFLLPIHGRNT